MMVVVGICLCMHIELSPYEYRDRQVLHYFDLFGMISIMITIVSGMICQYEVDDDC